MCTLNNGGSISNVTLDYIPSFLLIISHTNKKAVMGLRSCVMALVVCPSVTELCLDKVKKVFVSGSRMTAVLLCFLLAAPVLLVAGSPVYKANNGTVPLVLWHGMGE